MRVVNPNDLFVDSEEELTRLRGVIKHVIEIDDSDDEL